MGMWGEGTEQGMAPKGAPSRGTCCGGLRGGGCSLGATKTADREHKWGALTWGAEWSMEIGAGNTQCGAQPWGHEV